jgi:hypothetical protein
VIGRVWCYFYITFVRPPTKSQITESTLCPSQSQKVAPIGIWLVGIWLVGVWLV